MKVNRFELSEGKTKNWINLGVLVNLYRKIFKYNGGKKQEVEGMSF